MSGGIAKLIRIVATISGHADGAKDTARESRSRLRSPRGPHRCAAHAGIGAPHSARLGEQAAH